MIIPQYTTHESYIPLRNVDSFKNSSYLVFRATKPTGEWSGYYQVIDIGNDIEFTDRIIRLSYRSNSIRLGKLPEGHTWHGPFVTGTNDQTATIPPWETPQEFLDTLEYLVLQRFHYEAVLEDEDIEVRKEYVTGKAKNVEEFIRIWLTSDQRKRLIEVRKI